MHRVNQVQITINKIGLKYPLLDSLDESLPLETEAVATPVEAMKHQLKTRKGKALYALRKQTVEPVFGIIKSVMGFRQFSVRGIKKVQNEWNLVCLAWNVKRLAVLCP